MSYPAVIGIDVGGERKGYHAVTLLDGRFTRVFHHTDPGKIVEWCINQAARVIAVDAPSGWSDPKKSPSGKSRQAERDLASSEWHIHSFATPDKERVEAHNFYKWMLNGEKLYQHLKDQYPLFQGTRRTGNRVCFETFPCAIERVLSGGANKRLSKRQARREVLREDGYGIDGLGGIDYVDAALCSVMAYKFHHGKYQSFGNQEEGYIVVPM